MIETLATIIAVAAWCGQPVDHAYFPAQQTSWTTKDVDQCRQNIFQCLKAHPRDAKCFTEEKLDK